MNLSNLHQANTLSDELRELSAMLTALDSHGGGLKVVIECPRHGKLAHSVNDMTVKLAVSVLKIDISRRIEDINRIIKSL